MACVIAEPCTGPKDRACADACPLDCIYPQEKHDLRRWPSGLRRSSTALRTLGPRVLRWTERWLHRGDLAVLEEEEYCNITGRAKGILRGGENVYQR